MTTVQELGEAVSTLLHEAQDGVGDLRSLLVGTLSVVSDLLDAHAAERAEREALTSECGHLLDQCAAERMARAAVEEEYGVLRSLVAGMGAGEVPASAVVEFVAVNV